MKSSRSAKCETYVIDHEQSEQSQEKKHTFAQFWSIVDAVLSVDGFCHGFSCLQRFSSHAGFVALESFESVCRWITWFTIKIST